MNVFDFGDPELGVSLAVLGGAALATWSLTPLASRLAWWLGCVDQPGPRRVHRYPTPRLGGLAVLPGILLALACSGAAAELAPVLWIACGVFALGAWDDRAPLRPLSKLLGLSAAGLTLHACGLGLRALPLPGAAPVELGVLALPVTVLWVLLCTNAVNLIDGADGLGAGIVLLAASGLALCGLGLGAPAAALLAAATAGAAGGFLFHNHEPAKIFLGDSGSLLLGFLLAAVPGTAAEPEVAAPLLLAATLALGVPFTDTFQSFGRRFLRALRRHGPARLLAALRATAVADRRHIHHRLLLRGYSHRQVAGLLCLVTTLCVLCSLVILPRGDLHWSTALGTVLIGVLVLARMASMGRHSFAMAQALRRLRQETRRVGTAEGPAPQGMGPRLQRRRANAIPEVTSR